MYIQNFKPLRQDLNPGCVRRIHVVGLVGGWVKVVEGSTKKSTLQKIILGLGGVENGHMVVVGWLWVLNTHYAQFHRVLPREKSFSV